MIDLSQYSATLVRGADDVWSASSGEPISYPEDLRDRKFAVEEKSFWFQHRNSCIAEIVRRYPPAVPFFDIGGGNGFVARRLEDEGLCAVVVEPGRSGIENARSRDLANLVHAAFCKGLFRSHTIPSAGLFDVLEHIEQDERFLTDLGSCLQPGGRLYLTVPAGRALWSKVDVQDGHYRRYSASALRRLLEKAGLRAEYIGYLFSFLVLPIFALRTLPSLLHLRPDKDPTEEDQLDSRSERLIAPLQKLELLTIRRGGRLRFGTSVICVARKG
jgi:SAM-dependent methyltransferase